METESEDDTKHVNYQLMQDNDGRTSIRSTAKHVVPDNASTDEVSAAHAEHIKATTATHTKMLQGHTHIHNQELAHLVSLGDDGDANASPVQSSSGEIHNLGFHTHLRSTIRFISKSPVDAHGHEDSHAAQLVQDLTSERGAWRHAKHIRNKANAQDGLRHLSRSEIQDQFFSLATAAHSSETLAQAANAIATSARGRGELSHQLQVGGLRNRRVAQRLIGAVGKHLTRCSGDCSSVLSTLMQIAYDKVQSRSDISVVAGLT